MNQIIHLGSTPTEEHCAQVGADTYAEASTRECLIFKRMLLRTSPPPKGAELIVKSFLHDNGTYREVCVRFDDRNAEACDYAYGLEARGPMKWDAVAAYELAWFERRACYQTALRTNNVDESDIPAQYSRAEPPAEVYAMPLASAPDLFARFPI